MALKDELLIVSRAYADALGLPLSTVSHRVLRDSNRLRLIAEKDADITTGRFEAAMRWFSANWPLDASWPEVVKRPYVEAPVSRQPDASNIQAVA